MTIGVVGIETVPGASGGGFRIVTTNRGIIELYRDTLPGNIRNRTAPELEVYINNWLEQRLTFVDGDGAVQHHFYARVTVSSVNPLVAELTLSANPIV